MKFDAEDIKRQFCKGALIGNFDPQKLKIGARKIDSKVFERVNNRILVTVRQHEIERCNGVELASHRFTH